MVFDLRRCLIYKTIVYNKPTTLLYVLIQGFENLMPRDKRNTGDLSIC